jgi:hypothetical protein
MLVPAAGAAMTLAIVARAARPFDGPAAGSWPSLLLLTLWVLSPYLGLAGLARAMARSTAQPWVFVVTSAAVGGPGVVILVDGLIVHEGLLNALLLVAVPWLQWGGVLLAFVVVLMPRVVARRAPQARSGMNRFAIIAT